MFFFCFNHWSFCRTNWPQYLVSFKSLLLIPIKRFRWPAKWSGHKQIRTCCLEVGGTQVQVHVNIHIQMYKTRFFRLPPIKSIRKAFVGSGLHFYLSLVSAIRVTPSWSTALKNFSQTNRPKYLFSFFLFISIFCRSANLQEYKHTSTCCQAVVVVNIDS